MSFHNENKVGPNFLVIGAQKCGTTWLSSMICQHPEVSKINYKEIHYFNKPKNFAKGRQWYNNHFIVSPCTKAIGEYTPNYFWTYDTSSEICEQYSLDNIPQMIYDFNPEMKLILLLRNPVERAISAFYHHIRGGRISPGANFLKSKDKYGILSMGYYDIHLSNWLKIFPIENFLILIYETDLSDENKIETIKKTYRHLGIDESFIPENISKKFNAYNSFFEIRAKHYFYRFGKIITIITPRFIRCHKIWQIKVSNEEKFYLHEIYKPHNNNLVKLLNRTLPW